MQDYTVVEFRANSLVFSKANGNFVINLDPVSYVVDQDKARRLNDIGGTYTRLECEDGQVTAEAIRFNLISKDIANEIDFEQNVVIMLNAPSEFEGGFKTTLSLFCDVLRDVLLQKTLWLQTTDFEGIDGLKEFNIQLTSITLIEGMKIKYGTFFDDFQGGVQLRVMSSDDVYEEMGISRYGGLSMLLGGQSVDIDSILNKIGPNIVDLSLEDYKDEYSERIPNCLILYTKKVPKILPIGLLILVCKFGGDISGFDHTDGVYRKTL